MGAAYHSLHHVDRMPVAFRDAFLQARRERRPVVIGVPFDLQNRIWEDSDSQPTTSRDLLPNPAPILAAPNDVTIAADLVDQAERIAVMAGMGAVAANATASCRSLADKCGGLVATTRSMRGMFHDHPFSIGIAGSMPPQIGFDRWNEANLVITVGCSTAFHAGGGGQLWGKAQMLQIDVDPVAVFKG